LTVKKTAPKGKAAKHPNKPKRHARRRLGSSSRKRTLQSILLLLLVKLVELNGNQCLNLRRRLLLPKLNKERQPEFHRSSLLATNFTFGPEVLPQPNNVKYYCNSIYGGLRMAFDPTKSPHYKVIYAKVVFDDPNDIWVQIHTYSSKSGNWSLCGDQFPLEGKIFKLDIMNEHPVLTAF
nr:hypothetical protein [Tanacetum cinerariifolium]